MFHNDRRCLDLHAEWKANRVSIEDDLTMARRLPGGIERDRIVNRGLANLQTLQRQSDRLLLESRQVRESMVAYGGDVDDAGKSEVEMFADLCRTLIQQLGDALKALSGGKNDVRPSAMGNDRTLDGPPDEPFGESDRYATGPKAFAEFVRTGHRPYKRITEQERTERSRKFAASLRG